MTAAIFGLLGVVVGGLLNGGVSYLLDRARERADRRAAARLLADELVTGVVLLRGAAQHGSAKLLAQLPTEQWERYRTLMARSRRMAPWLELETAYGFLLIARGMHGNPKVDQGFLRHIAIPAILEAVEALRVEHKTPPTEGQRMLDLFSDTLDREAQDLLAYREGTGRPRGSSPA